MGKRLRGLGSLLRYWESALKVLIAEALEVAAPATLGQNEPQSPFTFDSDSPSLFCSTLGSGRDSNDLYVPPDCGTLPYTRIYPSTPAPNPRQRKNTKTRHLGTRILVEVGMLRERIERVQQGDIVRTLLYSKPAVRLESNIIDAIQFFLTAFSHRFLIVQTLRHGTALRRSRPSLARNKAFASQKTALWCEI